MGRSVDALPDIIDEPDRLYYETGMLLNADDFRAEQNYHRARLARALAFLVGSGTVAGLKVTHEKRVEPDDNKGVGGREEQLRIAPGLAVDPLGRMIEVPRDVCIRIDNWYQAQRDQNLNEGLHESGDAWSGSEPGVAVDLWLDFLPCERGKTPSFAKGPFASLDAAVPSRVRDGHEFNLVIKKKGSPPPPSNPWPDFSTAADTETKIKAYRNAIFGAWKKAGESKTNSVFIARIVIAARKSSDNPRPQRKQNKDVYVNNRMRPFVFSTDALARWLEIDMTLGVDESEEPKVGED